MLFRSSSGREALTSGEVTTFSVKPDLGRGAQSKGRVSIDRLCLCDYGIADKIRELALRGHGDRGAIERQLADLVGNVVVRQA